MSLKKVVEPVAEPVTLAEMKEHIRVDDTNSDTLISGYITAARMWCEIYLRRALELQTWDMYLDGFYARRMGSRDYPSGWLGDVFGSLALSYDVYSNARFIPLPVAPLITVDFVKYKDGDGVWQTMSASAYEVDDIMEPGRLLPAYGTAWPQPRVDVNVVQVRMTSGYARIGSPDVSGVPRPIKQAIMLMVGDMYDRRADTHIGAGAAQSLPRGVEALLWPYRVMGVV